MSTKTIERNIGQKSDSVEVNILKLVYKNEGNGMVQKRDLVYRIGNGNEYTVIKYMGRECEEKWMCVSVSTNPFAAPQT